MITSLSLNPHYDQLSVALEQINALLDVITSTDLTELKLITITNYFWAMHNIFTQAKMNCEHLANLAIDTQAIRTVLHAN